MSDKVFNVLFLCTGNSARSILAEAVLNRMGANKFRAFSAGSHPTGKVNTFALALLEDHGHVVSDLRSKSWIEFESPGVPEMDLIITVCDQAAGEVCPVWPGRPITAHWSLPDPAAVFGSEVEIKQAFEKTYCALIHRIESLIRLPIEKLDRSSLQHQVRELGQTPPHSS